LRGSIIEIEKFVGGLKMKNKNILIGLVLFASLFVLASCGMTGSKQDNEKYVTAMNQAQKYLSDGNVASAEKSFNEALENKKDDADAKRELEQTKKYADIREALDKKDYQAVVDKGEALLKEKNLLPVIKLLIENDMKAAQAFIPEKTETSTSQTNGNMTPQEIINAMAVDNPTDLVDNGDGSYSSASQGMVYHVEIQKDGLFTYSVENSDGTLLSLTGNYKNKTVNIEDNPWAWTIPAGWTSGK
jgi:hypothetical protein